MIDIELFQRCQKHNSGGTVLRFLIKVLVLIYLKKKKNKRGNILVHFLNIFRLDFVKQKLGSTCIKKN